MYELKFECHADFLGSTAVEGNNIDAKSLSDYAKILENADRHKTCLIRISSSGLSTTFAPQQQEDIKNHRFPFASLLVGHVISDKPRTIVWVIRDSTSPDSVNAYAWHCDRDEDAKRLMEVFQEIRGKKKMEKLAQIRQKLEEKGLFANRIPLGGFTRNGSVPHLDKAVDSHDSKNVSAIHAAIKKMSLSNDDVSKPQVTMESSPKPIGVPINGTKVLPTKENGTLSMGQPVKSTEKPALIIDTSPRTIKKEPKPVEKPNGPMAPKEVMTAVVNANNKANGVHQSLGQQTHISDKSKIDLLLKADRPNPNRQVIVAASRSGQNKKPDTRQRQPAMLISATSQQEKSSGHLKHAEIDEKNVEGRRNKDANNNVHREVPRVQLLIPSLVDQQRAGLISNSYSLLDLPGSWPAVGLQREIPERNSPMYPRGASAVSYGKWLKDSGSGDPEINTRLVKKVMKPYGPRSRRSLSADGRHRESEAKKPHGMSNGVRIHPHLALLNAKLRTAAISRSESLNSQGSSSSSESVADNQPKSVLKKPKRIGRDAPKKNVTFNAFATVQVMEV